MNVLDLIGAIDIRGELPHADWRIGQRRATTSVTWHYNGPPVPESRQHGDGLIAQLRADAAYQMRAGWGGTKGGAPGLMYHLVVDSRGAVYQTADLFDILWHCAHADGNSRGLALHFPLGGDQAPTTAQLFAAERATDLLRNAFSIPLSRVFGHLEWKHATACPGPHLMADLVRYRAGAEPVHTPTLIPAGLRRWQINPLYTDPVRVHTAPRLDSPIAGRFKPGTICYIDVVKDSEIPDAAHPRWVHLARVPNEQADLGFLAEDCGVWLA
jgi:hypothetical protein